MKNILTASVAAVFLSAIAAAQAPTQSSIASLQAKATAGNTTAQYQLGQMYENGQGVPQDYALAAQFYQQACSGKVTDSCGKLGRLYATGEGVTRDRDRALTLYQVACNSGDLESCENLAGFMQNGAKSFDPILQLYRRACEGGRPNSCWQLAWMYDRAPADVPGDHALSMQFAQKSVQVAQSACDNGKMDGCAFLAHIYANGYLVEENDSLVNQFSRKACDGGEMIECRALGGRYEDGVVGLPKDYSQAIALYTRACNGGDKPSCDRVTRVQQEAAKQQPPPQSNPSPQPSYISVQQTSDNNTAQSSDTQRAALEQQKQDIADQIQQLQSDKEEQDSEAENWDNEAEQLGDTSNCSGISAGICRSIAQVAVAKAQSNARKAREAAEQDQEKINDLQGQSNNLNQQINSAASAPTEQSSAYDPNAIVNAGNQQAAQMRAIGMCNACAQNGEVAQYKSDCSQGVMSACYRAAAALCQCQLNSGGCGSDTQQLQECVNTNTQMADSMKGGYTITPGNSSSSTNSSRPSGASSQQQSHCPPGGNGSACANAGW